MGNGVSTALEVAGTAASIGADIVIDDMVRNSNRPHYSPPPRSAAPAAAAPQTPRAPAADGFTVATESLSNLLLAEGPVTDGGRAIFEALHAEPADAVLYLPPRVNTGDYYRDTYPDYRPLILAPVAKGDDDTAHILIGRGCDKSLKKVWTYRGGSMGPLEYTVLSAAAFVGNRLVWERLLKAGAKAQADTLSFAAYTGSAAIMVAFSRDVSQPAYAGSFEGVAPVLPVGSGSTVAVGPLLARALPVAAGRGHLPCVKTMMKLAARADATTAAGETALHAAAEGPLGWHVECTRSLESPNKDAEPYAKMRRCLNVPRQPISSPDAYRSIIRTLVDNGADIEAKGKGGMTPLLRACEFGHYAAIVELLLCGANANVKSACKEDVFELLAMGQREFDAKTAFMPPRADASSSSSSSAGGAGGEANDSNDRAAADAAARERIMADDVASRLLQRAEEKLRRP